jgi:pyrroline-5-carboxylate reductase
MVIGFVGAGSMAAALARGWVGAFDRMLFSDSGSGRAAALAEEVGGEALSSNRELAAAADLVVLAVKPAKLDDVAAELGDARAVVSLLGATPLERVAAALPGAAAFRVMPNVAVEVRRGVLCFAAAEGVDEALRNRVKEKLELLGLLVELPDGRFDAATAVMGCAPAYLALAIEAIAEAGAEAGLEEELSRRLVTETAAGTAELLRRQHPAELRKAVASPGGSTEAGLEALESHGVREAFNAAVKASLARMEA